jgi:hypothetical protein
MIKNSHGIPFEVKDLGGVQELERHAYEKDFKPSARILKRRTGSSRGISQLRGRRSGIYYVSTPGTIAIVKEGLLQWYTMGGRDVVQFLNDVLREGERALTSRLL